MTRAAAGRPLVLLRLVMLNAGLAFLVAAPFATPRMGETGVSAYFLPLAILVASLCLTRQWPHWLVACIGFLIGFSLWTAYNGDSVLQTAPFLAVDLVEAVVIAWLLWRSGVVRSGIRRPRHAVHFFAVIAAVPAACALPAAYLAELTTDTVFVDAAAYWSFWRDWTMGDLTAYAILVAAVLLIHDGWRRGWSLIKARRGEFAAAIAFLVLAVMYDFEVLLALERMLVGSDGLQSAPHPALMFLTAPAVVWLAGRYAQVGAAIGILLTAMPAIQLVAAGYGPAWMQATGDRVLILQAYLIVSSLVAICVASLSHHLANREHLLRRALRLANARAEDRAQFFGLLSHEMRTPLNGIQGFAQLMALELDGPLPERMRDQLSAIQISTKRMTAMVDRLLVLSRAMRDEPARDQTAPDVCLADRLVSLGVASREPVVANDDPGQRQWMLATSARVPVTGPPALIDETLRVLAEAVERLTEDGAAIEAHALAWGRWARLHLIAKSQDAAPWERDLYRSMRDGMGHLLWEALDVMLSRLGGRLIAGLSSQGSWALDVDFPAARPQSGSPRPTAGLMDPPPGVVPPELVKSTA